MYAIIPIKAVIFNISDNEIVAGVLYCYEVSFPGTKRKSMCAYGFQFAVEADIHEKTVKEDFCDFGGHKFQLEAVEGSNYYEKQEVAEEIMAKCQMNLMLTGYPELEKIEAGLKFKYAPTRFSSYVGMHEVVFPNEKKTKKVPVQIFGDQIFEAI